MKGLPPLKLKGVKPKNKKAVLALGISIPIIIVVIVVLYFKYPPFKAFVDKTLKRGPALVAVAPAVDFSLTPNEVKPNSQFVISGKFSDGSGNPVTVAQGFYYVFRQDKADPTSKMMVTQGSLGAMISDFSVPVSTAGWVDASYSIDVTDQPLSPAEISPKQMGTSLGPAASTSGVTPQYNPITGSFNIPTALSNAGI